MGTWYGGPGEAWESFIQRAWGDVRRNEAVLVQLRATLAPYLPVVRIWDALLWRVRIEQEARLKLAGTRGSP